MKTIETCPHCGLEVAVDPFEAETTLCPRCECPVAEIGRRLILVPDPEVPYAGTEPVVLGMGVHTLGRKSGKSSATVQIGDRDVFMSKCHTRIVVRSNGSDLQVTVSDAGSANGTYVNGRRLNYQEEVAAGSGDWIKMGNSRFRIELE